MERKDWKRLMKKQIKNKTIKIYASLDNGQSSFVHPARKKQLKLAKRIRIKSK